MRVIWVALVALILLNNSHGQMQDLSDTAMSPELDLIEIIGGNVQNFQSSSEISFDVGYIDSEIIEIKWFLKDGDILRYDGESEYQSETNDWDSIPIHHHVISPCRCVLIIDVIVDEIRIHREYGIVSAEDETSSIPSDNWVIIPKNPVYSIEKQIVDITYLQAGAYSDFNVRWGILPNLPNESDCIDGSHTNPSVNSWTVVENSFNSNEFTIIQDLSSYSDGWWTIIVQQGIDGNWTNWTGCIDIRLDSIPPTVILTAPQIVPESSVPVVIDGSSSTDTVWGREGLRYIWTITEGDTSNLAKTSVGGSDGLFNLSAIESGLFLVNLTIVDQVGHTNSTSVSVEIVNQRPTAALRIDGVPTDDGETIRLSNNDGWSIDAYFSTDTSNDVPGLTYVWYLDGEPILSGIERTLERPENDVDQHTLMLVVTDDNGEVDSSSVMFGIIDTPSDPEGQTSSIIFLSGILALVLFSLILIYLMMIVRQDRVPGVRPWNFETSDNLEEKATSSITESDSN